MSDKKRGRIMNYEIEDIFSGNINGLNYKDKNTFNYVKETIEELENNWGFEINQLRSVVLINGRLFETVNSIFDDSVPYFELVIETSDILVRDEDLKKEIKMMENGDDIKRKDKK